MRIVLLLLKLKIYCKARNWKEPWSGWLNSDVFHSKKELFQMFSMMESVWYIKTKRNLYIFCIQMDVEMLSVPHMKITKHQNVFLMTFLIKPSIFSTLYMDTYFYVCCFIIRDIYLHCTLMYIFKICCLFGEFSHKRYANPV